VLVTGQLAEISAVVAWFAIRVASPHGYQVDAVQVGRAHCRGSASTHADYHPPTEGRAKVSCAFWGNCQILSTTFVVSSDVAAGMPRCEAFQCLLSTVL
jgi:hypothetical protein